MEIGQTTLYDKNQLSTILQLILSISIFLICNVNIPFDIVIVKIVKTAYLIKPVEN